MQDVKVINRRPTLDELARPRFLKRSCSASRSHKSGIPVIWTASPWSMRHSNCKAMASHQTMHVKAWQVIMKGR